MENSQQGCKTRVKIAFLLAEGFCICLALMSTTVLGFALAVISAWLFFVAEKIAKD